MQSQTSSNIVWNNELQRKHLELSKRSTKVLSKEVAVSKDNRIKLKECKNFKRSGGKAWNISSYIIIAVFGNGTIQKNIPKKMTELRNSRSNNEQNCYKTQQECKEDLLLQQRYDVKI